jgi:hypothetical protein
MRPSFRVLVGLLLLTGVVLDAAPAGRAKMLIITGDDDKTSPITSGVSDFTQDDELYAKLQGDAPIHVLVQADSDWSKKTEPLAFACSTTPSATS